MSVSESAAPDGVARDWIEGVLAGSPVARSLGIEVLEVRVDRVRLGLAFRDDLTTVPGVLHGGVVATLIDVAGASASASGLTAGDGATGGATSHLSVAYLAPATSSLTVAATVRHRTRSGTHAEVEVRDAEERLVATATVTSRVFH
ncbi:hypothetical protein ASE01_04285 [Nocardioides sp. Root190]|uniref:PaaI family thioesterase n=1 Tax=Nocardioides sp. Root190 TaxID=1736488 RepID=UPI0006FC110E|nr:PaaI family thioesterase [Nocardioides sp. Root190]KRB78487.1 hypothetical protein ASE01_04285 [Nocardioides sp. Root190]